MLEYIMMSKHTTQIQTHTILNIFLINFKINLCYANSKIAL